MQLSIYRYQITILVLTFCLYASLHMARMTSSVVKVTASYRYNAMLAESVYIVIATNYT